LTPADEEKILLSEDFTGGLAKNWEILGATEPKMTGIDPSVQLQSGEDKETLQGITSQERYSLDITKDTFVQFDARFSQKDQKLGFMWHKSDFQLEGPYILLLTIDPGAIQMIAVGKNQNKNQCDIPLLDGLVKHTYQIKINKDGVSLFIDDQKGAVCNLLIELSEYKGFLSFYGSGDVDNIKFSLR